MEGIKKLAIAYYGRAREEEKESAAREFFKKVDKDGDGKVNHPELKESSVLSLDKLFKKFDGTVLDFDEALAVHYLVKKEVAIPICAGCSDLLVGSYFSCRLCLEKSYDLCCDCYGEGKFEHEHSSTNFLDHHSILGMFRNRFTEEQKTPRKVEMEGIKKVAIAYYGRASEEEKDSAREFFKRMDKNGDGKVSLLEFKKSTTSSRLSDDKVFKKLDVNGDGTLDFDEVLALHYMMEKDGIITCDGDGCDELLVGPYFSCLLCLGKSPNTYDLCCDCYGEGKFKHKHSSTNFLDHHSLFRNRLKEDQKTPGKKAMTEELLEIARAHYRAGSEQVQDLARKFFDSMDSDGDGQIDLSEFLAFMREQGHHQMRNPHFFKELDGDGNGTLDFWEVMTVYYIIKSGRPFCDSCGNFIPGIFFSCVECYKNLESSFTLCRDCYSSTKCTHNHNGRTQFLDNYTLLQAQRDSPQATGINTLQVSPRVTGINNYKPTYNNIASTAIVPARKTGKLGLTFKAFELALAIGNISATACTIL